MRLQSRNDDSDFNTYPSDDDVSQRAIELFFQERTAPREYAEYRRRAETELLERSFKKIDSTLRERRPPRV
jgi:hypothetical protein